MTKEGYWSAGACALLAAAAAAAGWGLPAAAFALSGAALAFFFRDPERRPPEDPALILAPGDGRVVEVGDADEEARALGYRLRVAIFLSVFDVHVNRSPLKARVERIEHRPGRFRAAFHPRAGAENSRFTWWLRGEAGTVLFRQVAGVLARRIVAWKQAGDLVEAGERIGLIRLGSRVEVLFRDPVECLVRVGDRVRGGLTPLARRAGDAAAAAGRRDG
jgi:phosphatidylserine decarboxylase